LLPEAPLLREGLRLLRKADLLRRSEGLCRSGSDLLRRSEGLCGSGSDLLCSS
jgi:hypothetical protein